MSKETTMDLREQIEHSRAAWLQCNANCPECGSFGWDVFNGEEIQRDDTCDAIESDDLAQVAANIFTGLAREFIIDLARGQVPADLIQSTAAMFLERGPDQKPMSLENEVEEGAVASCYFNAVEFAERGLEGGEGFYGYIEGDASSYVGPFKTSQEALAAVKLAHNGN